MATSHYGDVKSYAERRRGFINGCMEFDEETLRPLYRLQIGRSGKSQGIVVAERLGIPAEIIEKARAMAGQTESVPVSGEVAPPDEVIEVSTPPPVKEVVEKPAPPREKQYLLGDLVWVTSLNEKGRVAREADDKGNLIILVRGQRYSVNHKRLKMLGKREDLYPDLPNYDLRIVLTSKEDRKLDRAMSKRPVEGVRVLPRDPE